MAAASPIRSKGLHHAAYATRDPEATYTFYSEKLGLPLVHTENHAQGDGYFRHFFFDLGNGEHLAFFQIEDVGEKEDYSTAISVGAGLPVWVNHLAFRLDSEPELEAMVAQLHARGIDQMQEVDHGWCRSVYLLDPNGIMVEFCVTTDPEAFAQTEEEALALLRMPPGEIPEDSAKETSVAKPA
ncbi:MAG: VOC family protein [Myxococcota bacterium]|jgi:catechol 2,3-dioxygenase-like lactoylglutathione lyase family enzyme|nr:VOC family protein [Myxococcota bacterium]